MPSLGVMRSERLRTCRVRQQYNSNSRNPDKSCSEVGIRESRGIHSPMDEEAKEHRYFFLPQFSILILIGSVPTRRGTFWARLVAFV